MWEKLNDLDTSLFDLECSLENLEAIHRVMEDDGGANWQKRCNALFSACCHLRVVLENLRKLSGDALDICKREHFSRANNNV